MKARAPQAILFDIGNVFVRWDPRFLYEKLIRDKRERDHFLSQVVTLAWHSEHDRGVPFAENIAALSAQFPHYRSLIAKFDSRWAETIAGPVAGMEPLLQILVDKGIACFALTNFPAEKWPAFQTEHSFTALFRGVVVSGREKLIKPDPRIFQLAVNRYDLMPGHTLFVDDRADNIVAAEHLGFQTHHFTDTASLASVLKAMNILDDSDLGSRA